MPELTNPSDILKRGNALVRSLADRNQQMQEWYDLLLMKKPSIPQGRENYVGNDPRTTFNLARHLLTTGDINHTINMELLPRRKLQSATELERLIELGWRDNNRRNLRRGRGTWIYEMAGFLLSTGWYACLAIATNDRLITDVWNPAQVFTDLDTITENGPSEVYRSYEVALGQALEIARRSGWARPSTVGSDLTKRVTISQYFSWTETPPELPYMAVLINRELVFWSQLAMTRLPVLTGPVAGLPDRGVISKDYAWIRRVGESILATDSEVYRQIDRARTHYQQILRDTAQPPIREWKANPGGKLVDENKLFSRAYVIRMGPVGGGDMVDAMPLPGPPPDIMAHIASMDAQRQRGSFPDSIYGVGAANMSALMMSQITSAATSILQPYLDQMVALLEDVDIMWLRQTLANEHRPYNWSKPAHSPTVEEIDNGLAVFDVDYRVKVPGDVVARATVSRMVDPEFNLDTETTLRLFWPELKEPLREMAKSRRSKALESPLAMLVEQINAFEQQAELVASTSPRLAQLYRQAAAKLQAELQPSTPTPPVAPGRTTPGLPRQLSPQPRRQPAQPVQQQAPGLPTVSPPPIGQDLSTISALPEEL